MFEISLSQSLIEIQDNSFSVPEELDISNLSDNALEAQLDNFLEQLDEDLYSNLLSNPINGIITGFLKNFESLKPALRQKFTDIMLNALKTLIQLFQKEMASDSVSMEQEKKVLELLTFYLHWLCMTGEKVGTEVAPTAAKKKGKNAEVWNWNDQKDQYLVLMQHLLNLPLNKLLTSTPERDAFINMVAKSVYLLMENQTNLKRALFKESSIRVICICVKKYGYGFGAKTSILQNLNYFEHLAEPMAELLNTLFGEYDNSSVIDEIFIEIGKMEFYENNNALKSYAKFLVKVSELLPKETLKNISLIIEHLDAESYVIRCAMVDVIGNIIGNYLVNDKTDPAKKQMKSFFTILEERYHDSNAFVRGKVLSNVSELCSHGSIPISNRPTLINLTIGRLNDKNSNVRKKAIQLIGDFLKTHPFCMDGGELELKFFESKLAEINAAIQELMPNEFKQMETPSGEHETSPVEGNDEEEAPESSDPRLAPLLLQQRYYSDAIKFINQMHQIVPVLNQLLACTNKAEVIEALDLLVMAYVYKLEPAKAAIRKTVHLVWSKDTSDEEGKRSVKEHLIQAFNKLYVEYVTDLGDKEGASKSACKLIELTENVTLAELTSLEELISIMTTKKMFNDAIIQTLWAFFGSSNARITPAQRRGALMILTMMAKSDRKLVEDKIDILLNVGFNSEDPLLVRYACIALQRISGASFSKKLTSEGTAVRLPDDNLVFSCLTNFIVEKCKSSKWLPVVEQIINTIYILSNHPDVICGNLIKVLSQMFESTDAMDLDEPEEPYVSQSQASGHGLNPLQCSSFELSKLFLVVGQVAIKQIVHLEYIESHWKKNKGNNEKKNAASEDLDKVTGTAEDEFTDIVLLVREKELLYGENSLLKVFGPIVAQVCANNKHYSDPGLQIQANLALCKFMCVSASFCEEHLQLLFTILEKSTIPTIRSNIILALGDMAICFNHLIDQNINYLYNRLRDEDMCVKKNALMVLTHLILNGMVKVKGQLSEMAKCLIDKDQRISDLTKLFFTELSSKDNAIYNNLPDMISNLLAVPEDDFIEIMKFIFNFIKKDKQSENVVEKLCQRFKTNEPDLRKARDIAFCLSMLPLSSDKSVRKLLESLPYYQDHLYDPKVFKYITEIVTKFKKAPKIEKSLIEEFEKKVLVAHEASKENNQTLLNASKIVSVSAADAGNEEDQGSVQEDQENIQSQSLPASPVKQVTKAMSAMEIKKKKPKKKTVVSDEEEEEYTKPSEELPARTRYSRRVRN